MPMNKILWMPALVTLLMAAAVALAGAWLWTNGLREHERVLAYELLEEGGAAVPLLGAMTLDQFERRARQVLTADPEPLLEIARSVDEKRGAVVVFDFEGNLLSGAWTAPEIAQLLDATQIDRRRSLYALNGEQTFTEDNYARYNTGEAPTPARAYFRIYDELGWVMGFGQVQATAAARLNHAREQARLHLRWNTALATLIGGALLLLVSGICAWATRRWLLQPARQWKLLMAGALPPQAAATQASQVSSEELSEARTALNLERQARRAAEEARDQIRAGFDRAVASAQSVAEANAAALLYQNRVELLRRVSRGLGRGPEGDALRQWLAVKDRTTIQAGPVDLDVWLGTLLDATGPAGTVRHFEAPGTISLDPEALGMAIRALLDNASAAVAGRPDGRVSVNTERTGEGVEIRIVDNGPGISSADRPHIFAPLWSSHAEAMGLGLPVAAHLVALHGGTLTLHSEAGKGAAFVISLPGAKA